MYDFNNADIALTFFYSLFIIGMSGLMIACEINLNKMSDRSVDASYIPNWVMALVFLAVVVLCIVFAVKGLILTAMVGIIGTSLVAYFCHRVNVKALRILTARGYLRW